MNGAVDVPPAATHRAPILLAPDPGPRLQALERQKLVVQDLRVCYRGLPALQGVSFSADVGQITAIIGSSGCGKSSCLLALNRLAELVPGSGVAGRVLLDGVDVLQPSTNLTTLRRRIGMVFQKPTPFPLSIERNIAFPLREHGVRGPEIAARVRRALVAVGLWSEVKDRLRSSALALSGGQQQRLCIARAIALEPEVLLLDEPTSSLDPAAAQRVEALLSELKTSYAIVVVTHNLHQARRIADRTAFFTLEDGVGTLVELDDTARIFAGARDPRTRDYVEGRFG